MYENDSSRDLASAQCINQGIEEGQLCIFASVNAYNTSQLERISSLIHGYEENINKRNLLIIDLKPFYDSALTEDLTPFKEFEMQLQQELRMREDNKDVLIIADCADNLFINQRFDQCEMVENWWHDVYIKWLRQQQVKGQNNFTVICPYSSKLLGKNPFNQHKHQISHNHSITIDTAGHIVTGYTKVKEKDPVAGHKVVSEVQTPIRIIIAEPNSDLRQLYSLWLRSIGCKDTIITDSGRNCIDKVLNVYDGNEEDTSSDKTQQDIIIILDMQFNDMSSIQVAKEIWNRNPHQRIIFTTTMLYDNVKQAIGSVGINNASILTKPFKLSRLSSLMRQRITE